MKRFILIALLTLAPFATVASAAKHTKPRPHHALLVKHARAVDAHVIIPAAALKKRGTHTAPAKPHARAKAAPAKKRTPAARPRMFTKAPPKSNPTNWFSRFLQGHN